jgi:hypothetical protein
VLIASLAINTIQVIQCKYLGLCVSGLASPDARFHRIQVNTLIQKVIKYDGNAVGLTIDSER